MSRSDKAFIEKADNALEFLQGIEFDQEYDDPNDTKAFWEYYNDAFGVMRELLERYKTALNAMTSLVSISESQQVYQKSQATQITQAVQIFQGLSYTGRKEFYKLLADDDQDALYNQVTDNLIDCVHLTTKNRIDAKFNKDRNKRRGYIVPDECHRAENECLWKSAAWYFINGEVSKSLWKNLSDLRGHFDALQEVTES